MRGELDVDESVLEWARFRSFQFICGVISFPLLVYRCPLISESAALSQVNSIITSQNCIRVVIFIVSELWRFRAKETHCGTGMFHRSLPTSGVKLLLCEYEYSAVLSC